MGELEVQVAMNDKNGRGEAQRHLNGGRRTLTENLVQNKELSPVLLDPASEVKRLKQTGHKMKAFDITQLQAIKNEDYVSLSSVNAECRAKHHWKTGTGNFSLV